MAPDMAPSAELGTDSSIVARALDSTRFQWRRIETSRATIYAAESVPQRAVTPKADSVDAIVASHLAWLGAANSSVRLRLFFVRSRDEIEPITLARTPGYSEPASGSAYFVIADSVRIGLRHEVMHLLSWRAWGTPSAFWLSEGLATASVPGCGGLPMSAVTPMMDKAGMLIPLDTLRTGFTFAGDTGFVFYLESADLVQYIEKKYGRDKLKAVWSHGGLASVRETLGVDLATLEREWRATVAATPAPAWPGWKEWRARLNEHGCS